MKTLKSQSRNIFEFSIQFPQYPYPKYTNFARVREVRLAKFLFPIFENAIRVKTFRLKFFLSKTQILLNIFPTLPLVFTSQNWRLWKLA